MPQFIIHSLSNTDKDRILQPKLQHLLKGQVPKQQQDRSRPICLVECQQIVREPVIAPETSEIIDDANISKKKQAKMCNFFCTRKPIKVSQLSGSESGDQFEEHSADAQSIMRERNLISILITNPNGDSSPPQTLELHFNLGFDRFFLVGTPCKLLIAGILRIHEPCLDVIFGLNMLQLCENTMIYVNEGVIDVYSKIDNFEHVNNRARLGYFFYGQLPDSSNEDVHEATTINSTEPEYIVYFEMNRRRRPVALFIGQVQPCQLVTFKSLKEYVDMYPEEEFGKEVNSELYMLLVMGEAKMKDRKFILNHLNLVNITFTGKAVCHVCGWHQQYFSFSQASIKIAGYVTLVTFYVPQNKIVQGRTEVIVRSGSALLYIDDYFAILRIDSEGTDFEVDPSRNKQKELKSISLMNINKKRYRPTGTHGYVSST